MPVQKSPETYCKYLCVSMKKWVRVYLLNPTTMAHTVSFFHTEFNMAEISGSILTTGMTNREYLQ